MNTPTIINTEKEYEETLLQIQDLMDSQKGTPESERLKQLATPVELYEDIHYPIFKS